MRRSARWVAPPFQPPFLSPFLSRRKKPLRCWGATSSAWMVSSGIGSGTPAASSGTAAGADGAVSSVSGSGRLARSARRRAARSAAATSEERTVCAVSPSRSSSGSISSDSDGSGRSKRTARRATLLISGLKELLPQSGSSGAVGFGFTSPPVAVITVSSVARTSSPEASLLAANSVSMA